MSLQPWQLISALIFVIMGAGIWYIKKTWMRIVIISFAFIMFAFSPVRFKQEGAVILERGGPDFSVPRRVTVKQKTFEQQQADSLVMLKDKSKEYFNENE